MAIRLHVGCGTVYLDGYVNIDVPVEGYSFLASERPDLVAGNRTTVDRYYTREESRETLEHGPGRPQVCVVDRYAPMDSLPYPPNSVDEIRSVQCLEHVSMKEGPRILGHWFEILKPGGVAHVDVPDFEETARQLLAQPDEASKEWYYRLVYGSQKNAYAYHKNGFSPARLERMLREAGFREVRHLPNRIHFYPVTIAEGIK
ncbi:MAG TPA: methyltransferase domain-containing protein [Candidatus Eisenbacteria bacterium]|nr:methyltransferase domain-containing protein [Candidatus Eisenbacteria bacterium]